MAYFVARAAAVIVGEQAEYARVARVSGDFFRVFGVQPIAGRLFDSKDMASGPPTIAILGNSFAKSHFGGGSQAIGRTIRINSGGTLNANRPLSIVGVVASDFTFPEGAEIWVPQPLPDTANALSRGGQNFRAAARLKPDVNLKQAQSEMTTIAARLEAQYPDTNTGRRA